MSLFEQDDLKPDQEHAHERDQEPLKGSEPCLPFDLMGHDLANGLTLVEASAGTGKTYSITWLVTRLLLERDLEPADLLVVTFTVAATEEMKGRIRAHIAHALTRWPRLLDDALRPEEAPELRAIYERLTPAQRAGGAARLQRAVDRFEEAQISTIHGFCSQALRSDAVGAGVEVGRVQTHLQPLFDEVVDDYRSLVFSQSSLQSLRLMESLRKTLNLDRAGDLMPLVRAIQTGGWSAVLCDPAEAPTHPRVETPARLLAAAADPAAVTPQDVVLAWGHVALTFTQDLIDGPLNTLVDEGLSEGLRALLAEVNLNAKWNKDSNEEAQALGWAALEQLRARLKALRAGEQSLARRLAPDEGLPLEADLLTTLIALSDDLCVLSTSGLRAGLSKSAKKANAPYYELSHPFSDALDALSEALEGAKLVMRAWFRLGMARYAERELSLRKAAGGFISTDDLIHLTRAALEAEGSPLRAALRARFKGALLDEFQDTDPTQWSVFELVFGDAHAPVYLIGDPKQSIYRFRGADLNAYLAVKASTPPSRRFTMSRNFRSDPRVLNVLNQLFDPRSTRLLADHYGLAPAGESSEGEGFFEDARVPYVHVDGGRPDRVSDGPAARLVHLPYSYGVKPDGDLVEQVAADVCRLLRAGREVWPKGVGVGRPRPLRVSDIGVLVRTNRRARLVSQALARRGIPSAVRSDDSVFKTHAAAELEALLRGVLMPHDDDALRAALSVDALALTAQEVRMFAEEGRELFTLLHATWLDRGLAAAFQGLLYQPRVRLAARVLRQPEGAQTLTHLLHLVERAQGHASASHLSPELTLQWIRERRLDEDSEVLEEDKVRPHIDGEAVEVVTVHRSKGLEYPILFCPDLWVNGGGGNKPPAVTVLEPSRPGERRALDARLLPDSPPEPRRDEALARVREAEEREQRRLIYVALTRPLHQLHIYFGVNRQHALQSPFLHMIAGPGFEPTKAKNEDLDQQLALFIEERVAASEGAATWETAPVTPSGEVWADPNAHARPLAAHPPQNPTEPAWRVASFSALSRVVRAAEESRFALADAPEVDEEERARALSVVPYAGPAPAFLRLPPRARSARFGQCLHALMEQVEFDECAPDDLRRASAQALGSWGFTRDWGELIAEGVWDALHTPLSGAGEGARLRDVPRALRRDEVGFELCVQSPTPLRAELLNALLRLDPSCEGLPPFPDDFALSGFLKGSIDLMFRHPNPALGAPHGRYLIADYKSNWLGEGEGEEATSTLSHYHPRALEGVMTSSLYLLQSSLYIVALHRLLAARLGDAYRYEEHCGGALYLFLRGMAGERSVLPPEVGRAREAAGVFAHRPPREAVELLSLALDDADAAERALRAHRRAR